MKCRLTIRNKKGIALVITLVMLAIVTVMAIVFLAVTRRERSSMKTTEETALAKDMADAALERAKTEATAGMNANGSKLHYELFNSQTFSNPNGFSPNLKSNINVVPVHDWARIRQGSQGDYLQLLANLQYDPAVPVFVQTNQNGQGELRHYLDFNRNRQFETNGMLYDLDFNERPIVRRIGNQDVTNRYRFVGDPEWIGVLARPDYPHSETNRFMGRMAYIVMPAGKSLDLNFIHNQVNPDEQLDRANARNGFSRSQGIGSWELNMAAFLRELNGNTYAWRPAAYQYTISANGMPTAVGDAFNDARSLLSFRYNRRSFLKSMLDTLGRDNLLNPITTIASFEEYRTVDGDNIEDFGFHPLTTSWLGPNPVGYTADPVHVPGWPGSLNTNAFTDLQQLFSVRASSAAFTNRLQVPARLGATGNSGKSSYDRYTYYRLASQLGTDSTPALEGKVHLNFKNPVGQVTNTVVPWNEGGTNDAVEFFTLAANQMLRASIDGMVTISNPPQMRAYGRGYGTYYVIADTLVSTNFSMTNIQVETRLQPELPFVYQNEYTPTIHRILQVAANIYDNKFNQGTYPYHPTVFVPIIAKTGTNMIINGFMQAHDSEPVTRPWRDFTEVLTNATPFGPITNVNFYGQHMVIGAKKGHPNFNELELRSDFSVSRKMATTRAAGSTNIVRTNQMFVVNLENRWGMEAWNSYTNSYDRNLQVVGSVLSQMVLRDGTNLAFPPVFDQTLTTGLATNLASPWVGTKQLRELNLKVLFTNTFPAIRERGYIASSGVGTNRFTPGTAPATFGPIEPTPQFVLQTTNRVNFWLIDTAANRIIDFVSYDNLTTEMDFKRHLNVPASANNSVAAPTSSGLDEQIFWDPTPLAPGSLLTIGHSNQLAMSAGEFDEVDPVRSDALWRPYGARSPDKRGAISIWRKIMALPLRQQDNPNAVVPPELSHQAPFSPTRQMQYKVAWQVNDPLVHYMHQDLLRIEQDAFMSVLTPAASKVVSNLGFGNDAFQPWGGNLNQQNPPGRFNVGLKDPGIRTSDNWEFPGFSGLTVPLTTARTNYFYPNLGALGQVHRGTPWQTLYLKSIYRRRPDQVGSDGKQKLEFLIDPSFWARERGSIGTYPSRDWRLLDIFTTAMNENAARGLLSVNQTNSAAWAAVLGGAVVAKTEIRTGDIKVSADTSIPARDGFQPAVVLPGSAEMAAIVESINDARTNQFRIVSHPQPGANPSMPFIMTNKMNQLVNLPANVFDHMGDVLGAPALSVQNPYLLGFLQTNEIAHVQSVWTDKAVEFMPAQILSLLRRDEPRFVVYAFGQSLKPAPRSLTSDPNFYHMCTNYQITGEVITKTTFRVEGQPFDPRIAATAQSPLRTVIEKYEILPPSE